MKNRHRRMPAYGEREHGGRYILDDYCWSRNHTRAATIRRWKRGLKKKARVASRATCQARRNGSEQEKGGRESSSPSSMVAVSYL